MLTSDLWPGWCTWGKQFEDGEGGLGHQAGSDLHLSVTCGAAELRCGSETQELAGYPHFSHQR